MKRWRRKRCTKDGNYEGTWRKSGNKCGIDSWQFCVKENKLQKSTKIKKKKRNEGQHAEENTVQKKYDNIREILRKMGMKGKEITGDKIKMDLGLNKKQSTSKICEKNPMNSSKATSITPV